MIHKLSPEIRRIILQYAAKENMAFEVAMEYLILEGFKALGEQNYQPGALVNKAV